VANHHERRAPRRISREGCAITNPSRVLFLKFVGRTPSSALDPLVRLCLRIKAWADEGVGRGGTAPPRALVKELRKQVTRERSVAKAAR
jgi:hypothetical protein